MDLDFAPRIKKLVWHGSNAMKDCYFFNVVLLKRWWAGVFFRRVGDPPTFLIVPWATRPPIFIVP
jgi:hypothetical protein